MSHDDYDDEDLAIGARKGPSVKVLAVVQRPAFVELANAVAHERSELGVTLLAPAAFTPAAAAAADLIVFECRIAEGFEDLASIRRLRAVRSLVPIVVLTANDDRAFNVMAYQAGATDLLGATTPAGILAEKLMALYAIARAAGMMELQNSELARSLVALRHEMGARIEAQTQAMESAKLASLGEMAGGIAHEVKTPLAVITGGASMIRSMLESPDADIPATIELLQDVEKMADRITAVIRGLKSFSRQGEADPFESTTIATIFDETLPLCDDIIKRDGVDLKVELPEGLAIDCQSTQISQIVLNLLVNAKHATDKLDDKWIKLRVEDLGDAVEISVTDSGSGIPEELQDKIFLPFFTTKAKGVGTGLGLSISTKIAVAHGGRLYLDKTAKNTRFVVRLPKVSRPAA